MRQIRIITLVTQYNRISTYQGQARQVYLKVLSIAPLCLRALLLNRIERSLIAHLHVLMARRRKAKVLMSLTMITYHEGSPQALNMSFSRRFRVPLITSNRVVSAIARVRATITLVAVNERSRATTMTLNRQRRSM